MPQIYVAKTLSSQSLLQTVRSQGAWAMYDLALFSVVWYAVAFPLSECDVPSFVVTPLFLVGQFSPMGDEEEGLRLLVSLTSLLVWFRFLHYAIALRITGPFVRIIAKVMIHIQEEHC